MGSFSFTCGISGLSIEAGDDVRVFLLTKNPYNSGAGNCCYMHDMWIPRTPALRAKYNDYGSIDRIHHNDKFVQDLWLRGLDVDLVEKGVGDNNIHDVATRRGMTFDQLCEAIGEGRLEVRQDTKDFWRQPSRFVDDLATRPVTMKIPTLALVETTLMASGLKVSTEYHNNNYLVDSPVLGLIRVRWAGSNFLKDEEKLRAAVAALEPCGFATVLTSGSGRYAASAVDLLVTAPPGASEHPCGPRWDSTDDDRTLAVNWVMIREDVWQKLAQLPRRHTNYSGKHVRHTYSGIDAYKAGVRRLWLSAKESPLVNWEKPDWSALDVGWHMGRNYEIPGASLFSERAPGVITLGSHLAMAVVADGLEPSEDFFDGLAELAAISDTLGAVRHMWYPSYSSGPQFGEWTESARYLCALAQVAEIAANEKRQKYEKPSDEQKAWDMAMPMTLADVEKLGIG